MFGASLVLGAWCLELLNVSLGVLRQPRDDSIIALHNNKTMDKATIADVLEKIATLLELKDENPFKIRAYTNAARSLETWGGNIADLGNEEVLEKITGIGKAIAAKIKELGETRSLKCSDDLRAEYRADISECCSMPPAG